MGALDGRVAIITGAGRGIGREHALLFAQEGARVVVNDLGGGTDGRGADAGPAQEVVAEIESFGGEACASSDSVSDWDGGRSMVQTAIERFGRLDVLVNNAGILRDRMVANMDEAEWDAVIDVHLKGHFVPLRAAASYWRDRVKAGEQVAGAVINTTSVSGLMGNVGQANYAAAKAGIAALTVTAAMELERYGVRVNCVSPLARTRLTLATPGVGDVVSAESGAATFDPLHPGNVSPLVAYLATAHCPFNGTVFHVGGAEIGVFEGWRLGPLLTNPAGRWSVSDLDEQAPALLEERPPLASVATSIAEEFLARNAAR